MSTTSLPVTLALIGLIICLAAIGYPIWTPDAPDAPPATSGRHRPENLTSPVDWADIAARRMQERAAHRDDTLQNPAALVEVTHTQMHIAGSDMWSWQNDAPTGELVAV